MAGNSPNGRDLFATLRPQGHLRTSCGDLLSRVSVAGAFISSSFLMLLPYFAIFTAEPSRLPNHWYELRYAQVLFLFALFINSLSAFLLN